MTFSRHCNQKYPDYRSYTLFVLCCCCRLYFFLTVLYCLVCLSVSRWLQSECQLNLQNVIDAVQDTLLALEALTEFSYRQTNRAFYNLQLQFECSSNSSWAHTVKLDKSNFAELYTFSVCCLCTNRPTYSEMITISSLQAFCTVHQCLSVGVLHREP